MSHLHSIPARTLLVAAGTLVLAASGAAQCDDFEVTPVPTGADWKRAWFEDVSALAPDDAWAVGFYDVPDGTPGSNTLSLAMHWDGSSWTQTPTQNPSPYPTGTAVYLHGVAAIAPDDVWAGGERHGDAGGLSVGAWIHVQHWDGSAWEEVAVPQPPGGAGINFSGTRIYEVEGFASDDVWFGGAWGEPNEIATVTWRPLAMHWDGSSMEIVDTPVIFDPSTSFGVSIRSMSSLGPDDIWAVCRPNTAGQTSISNDVLHYDGSSWERVDVPDSDRLHKVHEIVAIASDDVWLLGNYVYPTTPFAMHYDGSSWTEVTGGPLVQAADATGPGSIYVGNTGVSLYDGATTTTIDDFADVVGPSIMALEAQAPCAIWAVGRRSTPSGLMPFAARAIGSVPSVWDTLAGGVAGEFGMPDLSGEGTLLPGVTNHVTLDGARPGAATTLVVGAVLLDAPFKGGTLVPTPDVLVSGLMTDATGAWDVPFAWPSGLPSGTTVTMQSWIPDALAPSGFAASHGLTATQP